MYTETCHATEQYEAADVIPRGVVINPVIYDGFSNRERHLESAQNYLRSEAATYTVFQGRDAVQQAAPLVKQTVSRTEYGAFGPLVGESLDIWFDTYAAFNDPCAYILLDREGQPMASLATFNPAGLLTERVIGWTGREGHDYHEAVYCNSILVDPQHQRKGLAVALWMILRQRVQQDLDAAGGERSCLICRITTLNTASEAAARATGNEPISGRFLSTREDIPRFTRLTTEFRYWGANIYASHITSQYQPNASRSANQIFGLAPSPGA